MPRFIQYDAASDTIWVTDRLSRTIDPSNIQDLVKDIQGGRNGACPLDGALDAMEDGSLWKGLGDAGQLALESIYCVIARCAA